MVHGETGPASNDFVSKGRESTQHHGIMPGAGTRPAGVGAALTIAAQARTVANESCMFLKTVDDTWMEAKLILMMS